MWSVFFVFVIGLSFVSSINFRLNFKFHPDVGLNIPQLLNKHGYPLETHNVVTEDEYIITIYRIPHGTCGSSENFLATGPGYALGFYLADRGFDVWIANSRGNMHARKHKKYNAYKDREFWNFGWHEVAVYDTPSIIDYVLGVTGTSQVFYVGHSQGTTSFLAFAAEKPEYNDKIKLSIQMAPSCLLKDTTTVSSLLGKHVGLIEEIGKLLDFYVIFPMPLNNLLNQLTKILCAEMTFFADICSLILYFFNYSPNNLIEPMHLQLILQSAPSGCSFKELIHYFQLIQSGLFRQYDYGYKRNMLYYGRGTPPLYNISKITSPISLFMSESDNLVPSKGVKRLAKLLPNLESVYKVPIDFFNHVDFVFSSVTNEFVNEPIYNLFIKYINKDVTN